MLESNRLAPTRPEPKGILSLVRIRLWLALLTMGVVPLAVASALLYATLQSQSFSHHVGATAASASASADLAAKFDLAEGTLRVLSASATMRQLVAGAASDEQPGPLLAQAERSLREAVAVVGEGLRVVWLVDAADVALVGLEDSRWQPRGRPGQGFADELHRQARELGPGRPVSAVTADGRLLIAAALPAEAGPAGVLRFELSLARMLGEATARSAASAPAVLVAPDGQVLAANEALDAPSAAAGGPALRDALPAAGTDRQRLFASLAGGGQAGDELARAGWVAAAGSVTAPGDIGSWSVLVFNPLTAAPFPIQLVGLVMALGVVLLLLTFWMSRQIVRPAEELEKSRAEIHRLYEMARADSLRDGLTGLGNHRAFQEELDRQLEWYRRYKVPLSLLLIDLDDLKLVNDSEGHAAGDDVLREMGRLIGEIARYADRSFRIGGDEFAILMPHTDAEGALQLGRRLLDRATQKRAVGRPIPFSAGISACPALATTRSQLYAQADAALYWCKRHGRAAVDIFDPVRDREASQEATSELSALVARVAATQGLLHAAYQPIVDLSTGRVIGFEGLIRPRPESGFSDPSSMFAAAESVGRTVELDQACMETVVREARGLASGQILSINLSPRFVEAPHFSADALLTVFARYGLDPTRVIVELTERENVEDVLRLQRNLAALQRAGIRVAADDVGAGNAGLRLLTQFRFDIVKIDLMLVQDGTERDSSRAVLRSLRELATRWGAYTIAEGLETVSQLRAVRELGIAAGQGYLLSRPMPTPNLTRVDLRTIEAGGVVLQLRSRENTNDIAGLPPSAPRQATPSPQPGTP
ncbi:MAG: bifunctional diguanylate cyclase/phosphodiesterase [Chloroflexota bacterium]|nr:bifunctional diguanylate cyclase/phosphodiesterase [Chloroflexota bacterium]